MSDICLVKDPYLEIPIPTFNRSVYVPEIHLPDFDLLKFTFSVDIGSDNKVEQLSYNQGEQNENSTANSV